MGEAVWIPPHVARHSSFGSLEECNVGRVQLGISPAIVHVKHMNTGNHLLRLLLAIFGEPTTALSRIFLPRVLEGCLRTWVLDSCNRRNWDVTDLLWTELTRVGKGL